MPTAILQTTKDKTVIELEDQQGKFQVLTLYKAIRQLEASGNTNIGVSYCQVARPDDRKPGQPDALNVKMTSNMDYVTNAKSSREQYTSKTIFGARLKRDTFPTAALVVAQRFRFASVGRNLKPVKPYIATVQAISLAAGKPKRV